MSAPKPSRAQRQVLALAAKGLVARSPYSPTRWYEMYRWGAQSRNVTATVESLIRKGLLETGEFVELGVPRLAVLTEEGRALLATLNPAPEGPGA